MENPKRSGEFRLFRGENMNGVKPIKETFMTYLAARNLQEELVSTSVLVLLDQAQFMP